MELRVVVYIVDMSELLIFNYSILVYGKSFWLVVFFLVGFFYFVILRWGVIGGKSIEEEEFGCF